jgi:hypothetical protein
MLPHEKHSGHNGPSPGRMTRVLMEFMGIVLLDASWHDRRAGPATPVAEAPGWVFGIDEVRPLDAGLGLLRRRRKARHSQAR